MHDFVSDGKSEVNHWPTVHNWRTCRPTELGKMYIIGGMYQIVENVQNLWNMYLIGEIVPTLRRYTKLRKMYQKKDKCAKLRKLYRTWAIVPNWCSCNIRVNVQN